MATLKGFALPFGPPPASSPLASLGPDAHAVAKGRLCGQHAGFNLIGATRVAVPQDFGTDSPPHPPLALRARPSPTTRKAESTCASTSCARPWPLSHHISWSQLLRRTFGIEVVCTRCQAPLRLIAVIKSEETATKILTVMHLPTEVPQLHPARPPPTARQEACGAEDWVN